MSLKNGERRSNDQRMLDRVKVADMLVRCRHLHEIATELGVSITTVKADVKAVREEWRRTYVEAVDTIAHESIAFNNTVKRLMGHMDDKLALEIARELTNPALAAKSFEEALTRDAQRKATNALAGRAAPTVGRAGVLAAQPDNALVDQ